MPQMAETRRARRLPAALTGPMPGLALAAGLTALAHLVQALTGWPLLSPMMGAMLGGIVLRNTLGAPAAAAPGLRLAMRPILRLGIILLGARLTFGQLADVGVIGLATIVATLGATFLFTKAAGRLLGVERGLSELIAAGTSICGASAVLATNTVTRAPDEDVAYAIACVTIFGTLSMLVFPIVAIPLGFGAPDYGLWVGASLHEVAQAVGAGFAHGEEAGEVATVAKLSRVLLLAPLILTLGAFARGRGGGTGGAAVPVPWFVFGFLGVVALNSVLPVPDMLRGGAAQVSGMFLAMALAAMGLETDLGKLRLKGARPLALGAAAWLFVSAAAGLLVWAV